MKNPLFIPKGFEEINEDGSKILYYNSLIQGKEIRLIEYYDKKGLIKRVNIWGICGKLEEIKDYIVAIDENIDFKTGQELKKDIKAHYPKGIAIMFC